MPWNHPPIKTRAADAVSPKGEAIRRPNRFWKKEPVKTAEAGRIAAETRIPSSELSAMSAARPSGNWIPFKDHNCHHMAATIPQAPTLFLSLLKHPVEIGLLNITDNRGGRQRGGQYSNYTHRSAFFSWILPRRTVGPRHNLIRRFSETSRRNSVVRTRKRS